jgi:hypothetical protein
LFLGSEKSVIFPNNKLWDSVSNKKIVSRDVVFEESYMLRKGEVEASTNNQKEKQVIKVEFDD